MVDYTRLAATAKRLIEANGRQITLRKRDRTAAAASEPWRGPDEEPTDPDGDVETAIAAIVPASGSGFGSTVVIDATLAQAFAKVALIAQGSLASGVDLREFDTVEDGTEAYRIANVEELRPASTTVIYALGLVR